MSDETRGNRLRMLRKEAGLSLRDVAAHLTEAGMPVTHQAVSTWENDQHPVPRLAVPVLEEVLGVGDGELAAIFGYMPGPPLPSRLRAIEDRQAAQEQLIAEIRAEIRALAEALASRSEPQQGRRR